MNKLTSRQFTDDEFYGALFQKFSPEFIEQMDITPARLAAFGRVEDSMRQITAKYDPSGCVSKYDVFAADPMPHFGATSEEWKNDVLGGWRQYVGEDSELRIHPVDGNHISLVKEPHIKSFKVALENAMSRRGI
jgi:thioesterase domain-containing protein